ncbi:MAG: hypothetical protein V7K90_30930 [Nostoc sp.]
MNSNFSLINFPESAKIKSILDAGIVVGVITGKDVASISEKERQFGFQA